MKKIPSIIKKIQEYKPVAVDYAFQKSISYSQLSMFLSCPKKWALQYRDGHKISQQSIHFCFGTSMHETLQNYLSVMYNESGVKADAINIEEYFEEKFRENYAKGYKDNKNIHFSSPKEMREFYEDGLAILDFIKKKRNSYFNVKNWHLVGIEMPIVIAPNKTHKNVLFNGFIDLVLYHEPTEKFVIYDIKTSGRGWSDKEKKDEVKQFQILLYKSFFSEQFGVDIENIDVEFFIVKRKIWKECEFPQKRVQQFTPANGKVKVKKSKVALDTFIEEVFNLDGSYKSTDFQATPSKSNCLYCQFKTKKDLCELAILK
jgi:hypothetical protein